MKINLLRGEEEWVTEGPGGNRARVRDFYSFSRVWPADPACLWDQDEEKVPTSTKRTLGNGKETGAYVILVRSLCIDF